MFIGMDNSTLNRLVVGSIPTASTTFPSKYSVFSTIKRARKELRRLPSVASIDLFLYALVILWTYRPVKSSHRSENSSDKVRLHLQRSVISLFTPEMNSLGQTLASLYLLCASSTHKEKYDEASRHCPGSAYRGSSIRRIDTHHHHFHQNQFPAGSPLPSQQSGMQYCPWKPHGALINRASDGGIRCD